MVLNFWRTRTNDEIRSLWWIKFTLLRTILLALVQQTARCSKPSTWLAIKAPALKWIVLTCTAMLGHAVKKSATLSGCVERPKIVTHFQRTHRMLFCNALLESARLSKLAWSWGPRNSTISSIVSWGGGFLMLGISVALSAYTFFYNICWI